MKLTIISLSYLMLGVACTDDTATKVYSIEGDACAVYGDRTSCSAHACDWFDIGAPCQEGHTCPGGECQSPVGSGSAGSGSGYGNGSAACACSDNGVCFEDSGSPIECYPPAACPGGCGSVCDEIEGHGTCRLDATVANLCICQR